MISGPIHDNKINNLIDKISSFHCEKKEYTEKKKLGGTTYAYANGFPLVWRGK